MLVQQKNMQKQKDERTKEPNYQCSNPLASPRQRCQKCQAIYMLNLLHFNCQS
jgi:hypothetical protein